ncbi:hypothetical protein CSOJ01_06276 [Colletotrichum sojae]|uniref:Uncharacterized protein n=1 Tax=Colletotrichum sojae TaxID=2175907 RepID=A0A8H6JC89_9PEZI|nr:hypothetical protein CSOJ01_06276 [Colletotrichum sojae]
MQISPLAAGVLGLYGRAKQSSGRIPPKTYANLNAASIVGQRHHLESDELPVSKRRGIGKVVLKPYLEPPWLSEREVDEMGLRKIYFGSAEYVRVDQNLEKGCAADRNIQDGTKSSRYWSPTASGDVPPFRVGWASINAPASDFQEFSRLAEAQITQRLLPASTGLPCLRRSSSPLEPRGP